VLVAAHPRENVQVPDGVQVLRKPLKPRQLWRAAFEESTPASSGHESSPPQPATVATEESLTVLVAEDNLINQRVTKMMLARLGYNPMVVANGFEAVEAYQDAHFDVILMDVQMPELDGLGATRKIREISGGTEQPWIIALTAGALEGDRQNAAGAGMNDYLTKPIKIEALRDALEKAARCLI